jgi:hypothetical protein
LVERGGELGSVLPRFFLDAVLVVAFAVDVLAELSDTSDSPGPSR